MSYPFQGILKASPKTTADITGIYTPDTSYRQKSTNGNWPSMIYGKGPENIIASGYVPGSWALGDPSYTGAGSQEFIKVRMLKQDVQYSQALVAWYDQTIHYINYLVLKANKLDGTITSSPVQVGAALTAYGNTYGPFTGRIQRVRWDCAADVRNSRFWLVHYDDSYVTATPYSPNPFGTNWQVTIRATTKTNVGTATTDNVISMGTANITGPTVDRYVYGSQDSRRPAPNQFMSDDYYYDGYGMRIDAVGSNKCLVAMGHHYATVTSPNNNTATYSTLSASTAGVAVTFSGPRSVYSSSRMIPCGANKAFHLFSHPSSNSLGFLPAYVGSANTSGTVLTVIDHSSTPTLTHYRYNDLQTYTCSAVGLATTGGGNITTILAGVGTTGVGGGAVHGQYYMTVLNVNNTTGVLTTASGKWDVSYDARDSLSVAQHGITSLYPYNFERGIIGQYGYYTNSALNGNTRYVTLKTIKPASVGITPINASNWIDRYESSTGLNIDTIRYSRSLLKIDEDKFIEVGYNNTSAGIYARMITLNPLYVANYTAIT